MGFWVASTFSPSSGISPNPVSSKHIKVFVIPRATGHRSYHVDRLKRNTWALLKKEVTMVSQGLLYSAEAGDVIGLF